MKGLVTWLVPQHVLPASHTHCSAWPSTMEPRTSISMTRCCSIKPAPELSRLLLASNSHQLLALRAIKSKVHAPAQHQTTTSQSCTVPRVQHSLLLLQDVDSSPTSPAKVVAHYNKSLLLPVANLKATTEAEYRALCCPLLLSLPLTAAPAALR